jgi:hypothetical protein
MLMNGCFLNPTVHVHNFKPWLSLIIPYLIEQNLEFKTRKQFWDHTNNSFLGEFSPLGDKTIYLV